MVAVEARMKSFIIVVLSEFAETAPSNFFFFVEPFGRRKNLLHQVLPSSFHFTKKSHVRLELLGE